VIGFPVGGARPEEDGVLSVGGTTSSSSKLEFILIGVALGAVVLAGAVAFMYFRLKHDYHLLAKDKVGSGLRSMWQRFLPRNAFALLS
jgi:hypothetical protein